MLATSYTVLHYMPTLHTACYAADKHLSMHAQAIERVHWQERIALYTDPFVLIIIASAWYYIIHAEGTVVIAASVAFTFGL